MAGLKVAILSQEFVEAACQIDAEFLREKKRTERKGARKYVVIEMKRLNATIFCPVHTISKRSPEKLAQLGFAPALIRIDERPGYLDFRKAFIGTWNENFFAILPDYPL